MGDIKPPIFDRTETTKSVYLLNTNCYKEQFNANVL